MLPMNLRIRIALLLTAVSEGLADGIYAAAKDLTGGDEFTDPSKDLDDYITWELAKSARHDAAKAASEGGGYLDYPDQCRVAARSVVSGEWYPDEGTQDRLGTVIAEHTSAAIMIVVI